MLCIQRDLRVPSLLRFIAQLETKILDNGGCCEAQADIGELLSLAQNLVTRLHPNFFKNSEGLYSWHEHDFDAWDQAAQRREELEQIPPCGRYRLELARRLVAILQELCC